MRKNDANPRSIERNREQHTAHPTNLAPILKTKVASISNEPTSQEVQVRELAFHLYEERGRRDGHALEDWLEAEAIILSGKQAA